MIEVGRRVSVMYEGRLEDGTVFDSSAMHEDQPLVFVVGAGTVIPGLEKAITGLDLYEKTTVTIPAKDAFGIYDESLKESVPSKMFPNWKDLPVGGYIEMELGNELRRMKVVSADENEIVFDFNHELADRDLTFDIEVVDIYGESGTLIENEEHSSTCTCGCHKLKDQLTNN